ncbi:MAG: ABC transporter substrate-binding protein [Bdellovibrionales bacterium]|nr:ABC transporter substrate-binding protein [Bdellovibrionales bacterium]
MKITSIFIFALLVSKSAHSETVVIGHAANFGTVSTSAINPYNKAVSNGLELAIEDSRRLLKAKGIEIKIETFDYGTSEISSLKTARDLISSKSIAAIGFYESGQALLSAPELNKVGLPLISPVASATRLFQTGPHFYPMSFSNAEMGQALATIASKTLNAKSVLLVPAVNCAYCADLAKAFEEESRGKLKITRVDVLNEETGLEALTSAVSGNQFDAVIVPNHELTSARIIAHLQKQKIKGPFLGGDGWVNADGSGFFQIVTDSSFVGYTLAHWHPEATGAEGKSFSISWKKRFGNQPTTDSAMAYTSMRFLIEGILKAKSLTRKDLQKALSSIRQFNGVTGSIEFARTKSKPILILKSDAKEKRFHPVSTVSSRAK